MPGRHAHGAVAVLVAMGTLAGCRGGSPGIVHVPGDAGTIAAAVAKAKAGDVVLVAAGVYHEMVEVKTARVTLRGVDRNAVVIDGDGQRPNGVVLTGDGTAVQNLTVRNATINGILVTGDSDEGGYGASRPPPIQGFLVDHVTTHNNGLYGVYAFNAQRGVIQNSYASGMADAGIYVGQCKPCHVAVRANVAERNAVGYEATNASGPLYVYGNRFAGNRVGATTGSNRAEDLAPQEGADIVGNVIAANNQDLAPEQAQGGFGIGVGIAGGVANTVSRNLIVANRVVGAVITNADDLAPVGNRIAANSFGGNGVDLVYAAGAAGSGNCLDADVPVTALPPTFPTTCPAPGPTPPGVSVPRPPAPKGIPYTDVQRPPPLPSLPGAAAARRPATSGLPGPLDVGAIPLPSSDLLADQSTIRW